MDALALGKLCLQFGRINRATFHEDGVRPETDTDHTVMLGVIACAFAPSDLDQGLIAQFALVHDLVEARTDGGDTNTAFITPDGRKAKQEREAQALEKLRAEFADVEWLLYFICEYEGQACPEARYVRYIDKAMPKITHILNGCTAVRGTGKTRADIAESHRKQFASLNAEYPEMHSSIRALMHDLMDLAEQAYSQ